MDAREIISKVKSILLSEFKNASIAFNDTIKPLSTFLDDDFINFINEKSNPENLAKYIKTQLISKINIQDPALIAVDNFINDNPMFAPEIQINETETMDVEEYLRCYAVKNMQPNGMLSYPGKDITLEELYNKIVRNSYKPVTIEDKKELCQNLTEYVDDLILDSVMDGMKITVREYITTVIPELMKSATTVEYVYHDEKGNEDIKVLPVETVITEILDHQAKYLYEQSEKERLTKEAENNKQSDNPNLVGEISVAIKENNDLEITTEIPIVTSSLLTDEETSSLLSNYKKIDELTDEEFYSMELNNIKEAIDKTTSIHDLDAKEILFKSVSEEAISKNLGLQIQVLIDSITELIVIKRNNIIKVSNNEDEYTDVILGRINEMMSEMNGFSTLDEYSSLYGRAIALYEEVNKKDIKDMQLVSSFQLLFNRISERRLNLDSIIPDQSPEIERAKIELNGLMSEIKQNILTIEHEPNNLGSITGTEIRLNLNIQAAKEAVMKAYNERLLTEDDKEYYMSQLRGYSFAIESETKIGYGLR